jgi:subtilase family serine protease
MSMRWPIVHSAVLLVAAALTVPVAAPASATAAPAGSCATAAAPGFAVCHAVRVTGARPAAIRPDALPPGYGPADLASAYRLPCCGSLKTVVAIVSAYNDPSAAADMAKYRSTYGLAACPVTTCFRQVNQSGATSPLPPNDAGWAAEMSLEIDMVSAVCQKCGILLVEATSASAANLYAAEDEAVALGARFVSNGWSAAESSGELGADAHFNHPGVAITAPSGSPGEPEYPGASRYVTAVGGTTLVPALATVRGWAETGWAGSGSGCSLYEPRPSWQTMPIPACNRRLVSDVSAVADPDTPVAVFQTYGGSGWEEIGGGSVPVPIIAAVYALAGVPAVGTYPASYPYAHPSSLFDITAGPDSGCGPPICEAGPGWDGPTGLGTPDGVTAFAP